MDRDRSSNTYRPGSDRYAPAPRRGRTPPGERPYQSRGGPYNRGPSPRGHSPGWQPRYRSRSPYRRDGSSFRPRSPPRGPARGRSPLPPRRYSRSPPPRNSPFTRGSPHPRGSPMPRGPLPRRPSPYRPARSPPSRQRSPPSRPRSPPSRPRSPPRRPLSPLRRPASPARRFPTPPRRPASPPRKLASPPRRPASPPRRPTSPPRRPASPPRRPASPAAPRSPPHRRASPVHRPSPPHDYVAYRDRPPRRSSPHAYQATRERSPVPPRQQNEEPRPPPSGPRGSQYDSSARDGMTGAPTGPAAYSQRPLPTGPARGRGGPSFGRGRGDAFSGPSPSSYGRGRGAYESAGLRRSAGDIGPPTGPRNHKESLASIQNRFTPDRPAFRSSNSTSATYPRTQRFNPHLAGLPQLVEGGRKLPSGLDAADERRLANGEAEKERLYKGIDEKQRKKRAVQRDYDKAERDAETARLRSDLAEAHLDTLVGDVAMENAY